MSYESKDTPPEGARCAFGACDKPATTLAVGRSSREQLGHPLAWYCEGHAEQIADEGNPEYRESCPNCGCRFGVN